MPAKRASQHKKSHAAPDVGALAKLLKGMLGPQATAKMFAAMLGYKGFGPGYSKKHEGRERQMFQEKHHTHGTHYKGFSKQKRREIHESVARLHKEAADIYADYGDKRSLLREIQAVIVEIRGTRGDFISKKKEEGKKYHEFIKELRDVKLTTGVHEAARIEEEINEYRTHVVTSVVSNLQGTKIGEIPGVLRTRLTKDEDGRANHEKTLSFYTRAQRTLLKLERFKVHYSGILPTPEEKQLYQKMDEADKEYRQLQHDTHTKKKYGKPKKAKKPRKEREMRATEPESYEEDDGRYRASDRRKDLRPEDDREDPFNPSGGMERSLVRDSNDIRTLPRASSRLARQYPRI